MYQNFLWSDVTEAMRKVAELVFVGHKNSEFDRLQREFLTQVDDLVMKNLPTSDEIQKIKDPSEKLEGLVQRENTYRAR
jgi:hypothetical protein